MSSDPQSPHGPARLGAALRQTASGVARGWRGLSAPERGLAWTACGLAVLGALVVVALSLLDWNMARGPIGRMASARLHRPVTLEGPLKVRLWSLKPSATIDQLRIGDPDWAGAGATATVRRLTVQIKLLPLLRGQVVLLRLEADRADVRLLRDAKGRATWDFTNGARPATPFHMPPVAHFQITDGRLSVTDEVRKLAFTGVVSANERLDDASRGFQLTGEGRLNQNPFQLEITGGPLLNVRADRPYPFRALVRAGATRLSADGEVAKPFDLARFSLALKARGPDLADLYDLTGVALPNTPPYALTGRLERRGNLISITGLNGRVGDSDLAGVLSVQLGGPRPLLKADLSSRSLDFDDLATLFGGAPARGRGEAVSAAQQAIGQKMAAERRLLPDTTLNVDKIRSIDADVSFRAASIHAPKLPLRSASVRVRLDRGRLTADPLTLQMTQGKVTGSGILDARGATPITTVDLRVTGARLEQLIPIPGGGRPITGALVSRIRLRGTGNSVHRAAAHADGEVLVVSPGGEIRESFAELLGVDVTKGLGLLWSKDKGVVPIRCAVADFKAVNGRLTAQTIVFDTGPVLATGTGWIDLDRERMSLRVQGRPKEFRLVRAAIPITVSGPILSPKVTLDTSHAVAQGGVGLLLASVVSPLAAILPFVDPGLAKDAACGALISDARGQGAPRR